MRRCSPHQPFFSGESVAGTIFFRFIVCASRGFDFTAPVFFFSPDPWCLSEPFVIGEPSASADRILYVTVT